MGCYVTEQEIKRLKERPEGGLQDHLYGVLKRRTFKNTESACMVQPADTQEWYHLVWERMADAAFVYLIEKDEHLAEWIHDRTMEIVRMPADDWVGPWYRVRSEKQEGALETAHITLAVCEAYENAGDVFSSGELEEIRDAIRHKGLILCRRFVDKMYTRENLNNWQIVLLNGYGTAAVVLEDEEEIRHAIELADQSAGLYNEDSYGESLQYSNYASLHLAFLNEILLRSGRAAFEELHMECYGRLMEWYAASMQRMKYMEGFRCEVPRTFAFGDSSNVFRPSGNVLAQIASRLKAVCPTEAGLASWLFGTVYGRENGTVDELASFGFFNQFSYHAVLMIPDMAPALSPADIGLPLVMRFSNGHILLRDSWEKPSMAAALSAGYDIMNAVSHRHLDQNSFQLTVGEERMLVDPGHCCYRLCSQQKSMDETSHNTISIKRRGELLKQRFLDGASYCHKPPVYNRLLAIDEFEGFHVIISDASKLYEKPVIKAVRVWITDLRGIMIVADSVTAEEKVTLLSRFVANNGDCRLQTQLHNDRQITFRRTNSVLDLYNVWGTVDKMQDHPHAAFDWTYLHSYYHPLPNQEGQGKEGSALICFWESTCEGYDHRRLHVLLGRDAREERCYDLQCSENTVSVEHNGRKVLEAGMDQNGITLCLNSITRSWDI